MKKLGSIIAIALPVAVLLITLQPLGDLLLSPVQCQLKRWQLPVFSPVKLDKSTPTTVPPLIPIKKAPFPCCEGDTSCFDEQIWGENGQSLDKKVLLSSLDNSLRYLKTSAAENAYQKYSIAGISRERVIKSLIRFRQLLLESKSAAELNQAVVKEFVFYQSVGKDQKGTVLFTAYFEPLYVASREQTTEYRYPIYGLPPDLKDWEKPHPTRVDLEGADGLQGAKGKLKGLELFWFKSRLEAYMIHIQGSAKLRLLDGTQTTVGYAGNVAHNYKSIGAALIDDGELPSSGVTMPTILEYFEKYPKKLDVYLPRDPSFVFFQENKGEPAQGSIQVSLSAERSIATDKSLMPPGALALIRGDFPFVTDGKKLQHRTVSRYVLDQDAGGAIKGAGRVDYFLGTGKIAGDRAGVTVSNGQLYYLLTK
ncbi:MltA domain-containing protein [Plectonema cf. radiosum LEGE 06105]|uniref:peptidoglycan lytic exotransglycosylase n=1 Tax=Plectonema cf. radiosum LEGE 06105 TaxID=945769 RepID=A0A8J7JS77_9CYAN|nr:MltA domain-containing protein [Plectonema radiosum]MBE9212204.1 MltA domain-containing protein [Plectonema cf. radiosum LEGE 06105]